VGDSRAVMGKLVNGKWEARSLSRDHKVKKKKTNNYKQKN
jgi:serine/threonine protein phosphatase PrpC